MAAARRAAAAATPRKGVAAVRLCCPFGFFDEDGVEHYWRTGQRVTDPVEIALLNERGAEIEVEQCPQP
ncbi:hypothetical protein FHR90_002850 [Endobacter medicaginis]|uniref:Uncharacterized protein n=1 Tax=Endobacter medicaginis TaxID=1181271 RepID=A0A850NGT0_9PROT|nr:hypothetical protein [Endobacter medicaginis]MBB3175003.1 hypothetical protein [Endobacter medicaginis]MCX5475925.1 hypothetical protein [Endobacter medicaginis]NVN28853.1 hypothetical protein [Endobacter medicaginis]